MTTANNYTIVFDVLGPTACFGLFINQYDHLYCSLALIHVVTINMDLNVSSAIHFIVGNTTYGSTAEFLAFPTGLFVDDT